MWQTWNALSPADGTWYSTTNDRHPHVQLRFQAAGCNATCAQIVAAYPTAKIKYGIGPNVGSGGTFDGNIDNFTIGDLGDDDRLRLRASNCTTNCYVNEHDGERRGHGPKREPLKTDARRVSTK